MSQDPHSMPAGVEDPPGGNAGEKITPPFYWFLSRYLSKVELAPECEQALKGLSEKGVVVYALKYRSRLNSLILHDLGLRKNIPQPLYFHGTRSLLWRPAAKIVRSLLRSRPADPGSTGDLDRLTRLRVSSVIYLRGSERDDAADPLVTAPECPEGPRHPRSILSPWPSPTARAGRKRNAPWWKSFSATRSIPAG